VTHLPSYLPSMHSTVNSIFHISIRISGGLLHPLQARVRLTSVALKLLEELLNLCARSGLESLCVPHSRHKTGNVIALTQGACRGLWCVCASVTACRCNEAHNTYTLRIEAFWGVTTSAFQNNFLADSQDTNCQTSAVKSKAVPVLSEISTTP
jgi:hypothetical protein